MSLTLLDAADVEPSVLIAAIRAATDNDPQFDQAYLLRRLAGAVERHDPLVVLVDEDGPAGWFGLIAYGTEPLTWETSTLLAPRLRGLGFLDVVRCWQAHAYARLVDVYGTGARVVTTVPEWDSYALTDARRYVTRHGWLDVWKLSEESWRQRVALVLDWPNIPVPHTCVLETTTN